METMLTQDLSYLLAQNPQSEFFANSMWLGATTCKDAKLKENSAAYLRI